MARSSDTSDGIELLAPNGAAFGAAGELDLVTDDEFDDAAFDDDEPRSPWSMWLAAALVLALIGVGVVTAAPWRDDPLTGAVSLPTTTVPTPTTAPTGALQPDVPSFGDPGWLLAAPAGWSRVAFPAGPGRFATGERVSVWATPDATRGSGVWLAVHTTSDPGQPMLLEDGTRFVVGDRTVVMASDDDEVTTMQVSFPATPGGLPLFYDARSHGLTFEQLVAFVADFVPPSDRHIIDHTDLGDAAMTGPLADTSLVWEGTAGNGWAQLTGDYDTFAVITDDGGATGIGIGTQSGPVDVAVDAALPIVFETFADVPLAARRPASDTITVWRDTGPDRQLLATWVVGDTRVTAFAYHVTDDEFVAALQTAAPATAEEWADAVKGTIEGSGDDRDLDLLTSGQTANGGGWQGRVRADLLSVQVDGTGEWRTGLVPTNDASVQRFVAVDLDVVLVMVPADDPARTVTVSVDGGEPLVVPLEDVGTTGVRAGLWVDVPAPDAVTTPRLTVVVLDAAGQQLAVIEPA
jgi:hypothetical protein